MSEHAEVEDLLPLYVSGRLGEAQRRTVEAHLSACPDCQADLAMWKAVAGEISEADHRLAAPQGLAERSIARLHQQTRRPNVLQHAFTLLGSQAPLVRSEIWPASAVVFAMGYSFAVLARSAVAIQALAPLVAAAGIAFIYGTENDPGIELALATPTSPRQVLLARLALVFGYDLVLALAATLGLALFVPYGTLSSLILGWLGPMAFLSAAALLLSLWIGSSNAIAVSYLGWFGQYLAQGLMKNRFDPGGAGLTVSTIFGSIPGLQAALGSYLQFWSSPAMLLAVSAVLVAAALWIVSRTEYRWTVNGVQ
ncbi:MAG: zf-HC2 domain-containing protein [Chloroflexi bacterium]|nr:zf-HC2 domain-containing protein [Chloroflexota bacterium]